MTAVSATPLMAPASVGPGKVPPLRLSGSFAFLAGLLTSLPWLAALGLFALTASLIRWPIRTGRENGQQAALPRAHHAEPDRAGARPAPLPKSRHTRPGALAKPANQPCAKTSPRLSPKRPRQAPAPNPGDAPEPDPDSLSARNRTARGKYPRLRLRPIVPLHRRLPIHSWLGGNPHMPGEIEWPMAGGKPALFLAQISCAHLPPRLWGKRGPRQGWLLAFTSQDKPGEPILRHVPHFGPERLPPAPPRYPSATPMRADILARATGAPAAIPRWPIEFVADAEPDLLGRISAPIEPQHSCGSAAVPGAGDPRLQPHDWGSLLVLLDSLLTELDWQNSVVAALVDPNEPDANTLHFLDSLSRTHDSIAALRGELCAARDQSIAFSPELRDLALRGLSSLILETVAPGEDGQQVPVTTPLLDSDHLRQSCLRWLDHYARRLYTDRPEDLPQPQRALFEHHWALLAQDESGEMGGPPLDNANMTVLRLPASLLMGWSFGASGDFHIALSAERLGAGDFDIGGDPPIGTA